MVSKEIYWLGIKVKIGKIFIGKFAGQLGLLDQDNNVISILSIPTQESRYLPKDHFYCKSWGENQYLIPHLEEQGLIMRMDSYMPWRDQDPFNLLFGSNQLAYVYCLTQEFYS